MTHVDRAPYPECRLLYTARRSRPNGPSGKGINRREAARRSGLSEATWANYEAGVRRLGKLVTPARPKAITLARMARTVHITSSELRQIGRDDAAWVLEHDLPPGSDGTDRPQVLVELEMALPRLDEAGRRKAMDSLETLTEWVHARLRTNEIGERDYDVFAS